MAAGLFVLNRVAINYRNMNYYNDNIFPSYKSEQTHHDFVDKTLSAFGYAYKKDSVFSIKNTNNQSGLNYELDVFHLIHQKTLVNGYVFVFNKLFFINSYYDNLANTQVVNKHDLMRRDRLKPTERPNSNFKVYLSFDFSSEAFNNWQKQKNNSQVENILVDPFELNIYTTYFMQGGKSNNYPQNYIRGIKLSSPKTKLDNNEIPETNHLVIASSSSKFFSLDAREKKEIAETEFNIYAKLLKPKRKINQDFINKNNLVSKRLKFSSYDNVNLIFLNVFGSIIILLVTYFIFGHPYVKSYVRNKKRLLREVELENKGKTHQYFGTSESSNEKQNDDLDINGEK